MKNYWLFKSEPDCYGIDDLASEHNQTTRWDGIRNYQARNFLRDQVRLHDEVFIYHSQCKQVGIAGSARVVKAAYPDPGQFDIHSDYFDNKASESEPRWFCVDIKLVKKFDSIITLNTIKHTPALENMVLLKQGRLSIQPVSANEWQTLCTMAR